MKRLDLQVLENTMIMEVARRKGLGGYSTEAEGLLTICETLLRLLQYVQEVADNSLEPGLPQLPKKKKKAE